MTILYAMIESTLIKRGCNTSYKLGGSLDFENEFLTGTVSYDPKGRTHNLRWKCKKGYEIFDIPFATNNCNASFKKPEFLLDFITSRLIWRKQR